MKLGIAVASVALVAGVAIGISAIGNSSHSNDTTKAHDRESLINDNDDVEIVGNYKDNEGNYIYYGIDGKGKLLEYKTNYEVFDYFYKGYAVGRIASNNYQLVDKDFNIIFEATQMKNSSDYKDYITYKDKETSLWGCMSYNGKKVVEPKYDDIEVVYCEDKEYKTEMIIGYIDEHADYYDANGKLIFSGDDSYDDYNFKTDGFGLIGNNNSKNSVLYTYSTGKKLGEFTYAYKGPVLEDSENKKYILHDENFNVIKEYPYENDGKKYTDVSYGNSAIWFKYNNDNKEYFSDLYSAKTGEFLFTIPSSDVNAVCDKDGNEYYVYNTEKNDEKALNIMDYKGNIVFTDNSGMEFVLSSSYVVVMKNADKNYLVYSMGDFKLISDIEYDTYEISEDGLTHIYIQEDTKECLYINSYGVQYKFNVPIETDDWIYVDAFLLYDYLLVQDKDLNKYIVDATTGKVTYDLDNEIDEEENIHIPYKHGEIAPYVERNYIYYDYSGNVIVDANTYGK